MPFKFRQVQDIDKNEKKTGENKQTHGQSLETQAKLATNIVHFPRKTNMGKCKRGHSLG